MKAIPEDFLWETYSWYIEYYYYLLKDQLPDIRNKAADASLYEGFEGLYKSMTRLTEKKGINIIKDSSALKKFVEREVSITDLSLSLGSKEWGGRKK